MNIIVGLSGGIAAYKACQLIRLAREAGHEVTVIPTANALRFVGRPTLEALSGNPVLEEVFQGVDEVRHVRLGQEAQGVVIAPATADLIARIAAGRADDMLTASLLVATCPIVVFPAMHTEMWLNPATQENVATLRRRGYIVVDPASGRLTGRDSGPGRMLEPSQMWNVAAAAFEGADLAPTWTGKHVVVTAGGTREAIDPVRFIGNASSGRQGFALAEMAAVRGADVTLIAADTDELPVPPRTTLVRVRSASELANAVAKPAREADVVIMAAAVADTRPETVAVNKLKKGTDDAQLRRLNLTENPDILRGLVATKQPGQIIVGFAAETGSENVTALQLAQEKLRRKGCDLLMCNEVGNGKGFGQVDNSGWVLQPDAAPVAVPSGSKHLVAARLLAVIEERFRALQLP